MENTGDGAKDHGKTEGLNMVAQQTKSEGSTRKGGKRSRETVKYLPAENLVFLTQALFDYQASGGTVQIMPEFYDSGKRAVVVLLYDTMIENGAIVPLVVQDKNESATSGT